jgi:hypothetical protein
LLLTLTLVYSCHPNNFLGIKYYDVIAKQRGDKLYQVYDLDAPSRWNHALESVPEADVFYFPGYCKLFEEEKKEQGKLFVCETKEGNLLYPFFLRRINDLPYFRGKLSSEYYDVISPYGYGGPLCSNLRDPKIINYFQEMWQKYCQENNIVTEFIRFHPLLMNHLYPWQDDLDGLKVEKVKKVVAVDLTLTENEIWLSYQYHNRKNINKAVRENLEVCIEENSDHLKDFEKIYLATMKRRQASSQYYFSHQFFNHIQEYLPENFAYAYVLKDKEIISAELLLFNRSFIHSFLGGTLPEFFSSRPNNLLKHQVILWAKSKGIKYFLLGGGYAENDGIYKYKLSFAPEGVRDFYVGKRVINAEAVDLLEKVRREEGIKQGTSIVEKNQFFPSYREGAD